MVMKGDKGSKHYVIFQCRWQRLTGFT